MATDREPPENSTLAVFRNRAFARYWLARFLATFAVQITSVAVAWQLYDATRDPFMLGLAGLVQFLPALVLVLITGAAADRFDRRRIMSIAIAAEALCAAALLGWTTVAPGPVWPIFAVLCVLGVARAFLAPAAQALVTNVVSSADLAKAIAWNSSSWQIATITGPVAGGLLYGLHAETPYAVAVVLLAASALLILTVAATTNRRASPGPAITELLAGFRYVRSNGIVLGAISLDLFAVLLGGATALLPVFARDILDAGPWGLGLLRAAPGIGALAMAAWLARRPISSNAGRTMFAAVGVFGLSTAAFGLSTSITLSVVLLIVMGAADMISVYVRETLIQLATPDDLRGRVSAVNMTFIGASNELGEFRAGSMAALIGAVPAIVVGGVGTIAVAYIWAYLFPSLLRASKLDGT